MNNDWTEQYTLQTTPCKFSPTIPHFWAEWAAPAVSTTWKHSPTPFDFYNTNPLLIPSPNTHYKPYHLRIFQISIMFGIILKSYLLSMLHVWHKFHEDIIMQTRKMLL